MSKVIVLSHTLLIVLLTACVSQPNLRNCRVINVDCTPLDSPSGYGKVTRDSTISISIPAPTGKMQVLYENERAMIFVNRDKFIAHLAWEKELKAKFEAGQLLAEGDTAEHWGNEPIYSFMLDSIGSSDLAVYDKLKKSCVTTLKKRIYEYTCGPLCGKGSIIVYLPDCTKLFQVIDWIS